MLNCIIFVEGGKGVLQCWTWIIVPLVLLSVVFVVSVNGGLYTLWFQIAANEESLTSCEEQCAAQGIQFFAFNPFLALLLTLSVEVSLKNTVESVVQTIGQVSGKPLDNLITFLNNN